MPHARRLDSHSLGAAPWIWALATLLALALWGHVAAAADAGNAGGSAAASSQELQPFQASYEWYWRTMRVAVSTITLQHQDDGTWMYSSTSSPRGLGRLYPMRPKLQSVMRVLPGGVVEPLNFKASGSGANHDADVLFDWVAHRAVGIYEGAKVDLPIMPGVQDDLSVQVAMLVQLLQGRTPDMAQEINKDSVREYDYQSDGTAKLETPLGSIETIVYVAHHPGSPRVTRFWCAPSLGYVPVKVQQMRLQDVEWTMQIRSLQRGDTR